MVILVAARKNKQLIYLSKPYTREELIQLRKEESFSCPVCGTVLLLKIGHFKIPHFAHKSLSDCESFSEPESSLHLQGKALLHQFFLNLQHYAELEKYLPEIKQRADLFTQHHAIEYQCSLIPSSEVRRRTNAYCEIGVRPIWIAGMKEPTREGIQIVRLKSHEVEMLENKSTNPFLLSLLPDEKRFYYTSNLFYLSGNNWVGKVKSLEVERQQFPFATPKKLSKLEFTAIYRLFIESRKKFIKSQMFAQNRYKNPFWQCCYELRLDMTCLPESFGIPLFHMEEFASHPVLWQLQAVLAAKRGLSINEALKSKKILLKTDGKISKAEGVINEFLVIYEQLEANLINEMDLLDILYVNYCKKL